MEYFKGEKDTTNGREIKVKKFCEIVKNCNISHEDWSWLREKDLVFSLTEKNKEIEKYINPEIITEYATAGTSPKLWTLRAMADKANISIKFVDWFYFNKTDLNKN